MTTKLLEMVAGRCAQVLIRGGIVDNLQLPEQQGLKTGRNIA